jgi:hypothetical protein
MAMKLILSSASRNSRGEVAMLSETTVRSVYMTDEELWRAIAENTDAISVLIEKQFELDAGLAASDPDTRQTLMVFNVQTIDKYYREYRDFIAEFHRRYPSI